MRLILALLVVLTLAAGVRAAGPPAIVSFKAAPPMVRPGQATTLLWNVTGAASLRIDPGVGSVRGISIAVSPRTTTSYTLTAANAYGSRNAVVTVTVGNAPVVGGFFASPAQVTAGQSSILSWAVSGANSVK